MSGCNTCNKEEGPEVNLLRCKGCLSARYCSKECQRVDWPNHKGPCRRSNPSKPGNSSRPMFTQVDPNFLEALLGDEAKGAHGPSPPKGLDEAIYYPFTRLENGTFLHDRSEKDVYKILIDSYRFRTDEYCGDGVKAPEGTIYDKRPDSLPDFKRYLELAATRKGLLPPWWTPEKQKKCEDLGMSKDEFQDLHLALEQFGVTYHYADSRFPQQLRMLAEAVYGTGVDGSTFPRRKELAEMEARRREREEREAGQAGPS